MAVRFAVIMAVLFSVAAALASKFCITFVIAALAISFFAVLGFAYSFKIKLSDSELTIYQYFMRIAKIRRSEICNIYFAVWAKNGQGSALVIETKNKTFTFPVRLYGKENVDNLITEIKSKIIIQPTLQKSRKNESFVNPTKFLLVIATIIILIRIFTKS